MAKNKRTKEQIKQDFLNMTDKDIDYSDIPDFPDEFWASAKMHPARNKKPVSIRLDPKIIVYFKDQCSNGKGYQTRINEALLWFINHSPKEFK